MNGRWKEMKKEQININTGRDAVKRDIREKKIKTGSRKTKKVQQDKKNEKRKLRENKERKIRKQKQTA
jgi:hypothetical protein